MGQFFLKMMFGGYVWMGDKIFQAGESAMDDAMVYINSLNTEWNFTTNRTSDDLTDPIEKDRKREIKVRSILLLEKHFESSSQFSFNTVEVSDIEKEISNINLKKKL